MSNRSKTVWVGIDPGKHGAIAAINDKEVLFAYHTPITVIRTKRPRAKTKEGKPKVSISTDYDIIGMYNILKQLKHRNDVVVSIEKQWARMSDAKSSVFEVGRGFGIWQALVIACGFELVEVSPTKWKVAYLPVKADKNESKAVCSKLYPNLPLPLVKDEAKAEAVLIADYMRRLQKNLPYPVQ